jgi:diguanylate cyclase (GGDEF)-like protein/PAS domain S-box-containing protein
MARVYAYLFGAGALLVFATLALAHPHDRIEAGLIAPAIAAVATAALMLRVGEQLPMWLFGAAPALGTVLASVAVYSAGASVIGSFAMLYFWVVLSAFYLLAGRVAVLHLAFVGAAYAAVLLSHSGVTYRGLKWTVVMATLTAAAVLLMLLRDHVETLIRRLAAAAASASATAEALRESEARATAIVDTTPEAFVATDDAGRVIAWNPAAERLSGWSAGDALGRSITDFVIAPTDAEPFARAPFDDGPILGTPLEFTVRRRDGSELPIEATIARSEHRSRVTFNAFARDITERRRVERLTVAESRRLTAIAQATREIARGIEGPDVRTAICHGVRAAAQADAVVLYEPKRGSEGLEMTAHEGALPAGLLSLNGTRTLASEKFASAPPLLVASDFDPDIHSALGSASAVFRTIIRDGDPRAVLAVVWTGRRDAPLEQHGSIIDVLGDEAAVAMERAQLIADLEEVASTDVLTELANRRAWDEALERELARAERADQPLSVVILDLDHFKAYNDAHGHLAGDRLLREVAEAWTRLIRPTDVLARYGGEEFSLALPDCLLDDALPLVERLRQAVPHGQTCSGGIASLRPGETAEQLMEHADRALYRAKQAGRNRAVASHDPVQRQLT